MPQEKPTPSLEWYVDQFIVDLKSLSEEKISLVVNGLPDFDKLPPLESIANYIKESPNRIPQLLAIVITDMSYYPVIRHFRWVDKLIIYDKYNKKVKNVLGEVRTNLAIYALNVLDDGEGGSKNNLNKLNLKELFVREMPGLDKIAELDAEMSTDLVSLGSVDTTEMASKLQEAQDRAVKAEKKLKAAEVSWVKTQESLVSAAKRGKEKVAQTTNEVSQTKLNEEIESHNITKSKLDDAIKRLEEIDQLGGATPEKVQTIREEIQRLADERVKHEVSAEYAPWLDHLKKISADNDAYNEAAKLSRQALELVKKEALERDTLLKWQNNREKAISILEAELDEIGKLIILAVNPSEALVDMHKKALDLLTKCRTSIDVAAEHGPIMEALIVGIKKTPDESIEQVANAITYLGLNDVIAEAESEILLRVLNNEKSLRKNKNVRKSTPKMRLSKAMFEKAPVDILVDGYNFMHGSAELFNKYLKFTKKRDKTYFTEEGKNYLAKLLSVFRAQNHLVNVHLFFDGTDVEEGSPYPGVEIHKPHIVKEGSDQADAEIIEYLFKKSRKDAVVLSITNDKAIQRVAAMPMAIDIFREYLLKINSKN
jgi:hypothetical protein